MSPGIVFSELPPVIWVISWISIGFWLWRSKIANLIGEPSLMGIKTKAASRLLLKRDKFLRIAAIVFMFLLAGAIGYYFFGNYKDQGWQWPGTGEEIGIPIFVTLIILSVSSLRFNTFLPIYFMVLFLPFMRIGGNTEVHMSFLLAPLSMLLVLWVKELYRGNSEFFKGTAKKVCLVCLSFLFVLGLADQILNIWACANSQKAVVKTNKEMAAWLKTNVARHSIVIFNFFNYVDVFYYSGYYFDPYETVENNPLGPANVVHDDEVFRELAERSLGEVPVYFVAADLNYYDYQKEYHAHKYVKNPPGELEQIKSFNAKNYYYYADPLKYFIMRRFQPIPLYMDWSIDFYYNNTPSLFKRVVYADYTVYELKSLYKLSSLVKQPLLPVEKVPESVTAPELIGDYKKYNIVHYEDSFYAVPHFLGPLDSEKKKTVTARG